MLSHHHSSIFFFFNDTATTEIYTLSLHDALPIFRGFELCRRLKEDPVNHLTPVVLVSAAPTPRELEQGREAGAADFWGTPSSLGEFSRSRCRGNQNNQIGRAHV